MMSMQGSKRAVAAVMAALMLLTSMPIGIARAEMVSTDQLIEESNAADDRARVIDFMRGENVQRQLVILGVDPEEAASRVAGLSDAEIRQIAGRLDELPAGEGSLGPVVGAIVLIFLVLLVTDLLGLTDVYPFVNKK